MALAALTLRRAVARTITLRAVAPIAVRGRLLRRLDYFEDRRGQRRNAAA
jgi:hypothetical protein